MDRNAVRNVRLTGKPSLTSLRSQFELAPSLIVGLSFLAGVLLSVGVFSVASNNDSPTTALGISATDGPGPARQVQDPSIVPEVQGVVCEDGAALIDDTASAADVISVWNSTIESAGDECTFEFQSLLGAPWAMNEPTIDIFGNAGSSYEFMSGNDGLVTGLTIELVLDDSLDGERDALISAITTVWGSERLDWEFSCLDTERPWAGIVRPDDLTLEISRC